MRKLVVKSCDVCHTLERLKIMENEKEYTLQQQISHARFNKDRNWRNFQQLKSNLAKMLDDLSKKKEDELTKSDLLGLIQCNCDYMRALSLYNYWRDELTSLLMLVE